MILVFERLSIFKLLKALLRIMFVVLRLQSYLFKENF